MLSGINQSSSGQFVRKNINSKDQKSVQKEYIQSSRIPKDREGFMQALSQTQRPHTVFSSKSLIKRNIQKIADQRQQNQGQNTSSTLSLMQNTQQIRSPQNKLQFSNSLLFEPRTDNIPQSSIRKPVIESLVTYSDKIIPNKSLLNNVFKLKEMSLLNQRGINLKKDKTGDRLRHTLNDYHTLISNGGYSRKRSDGGFFFH